MDRTHVVYRCFDADGELLYIGYTSNWMKRRQNHACVDAWWPNVTNVTFSRRMSRDDAQVSEAADISRTRPRYNVQHNPDHVGTFDHVVGRAISRSTYIHHRCRCAACRAENARYGKQYYQLVQRAAL